MTPPPAALVPLADRLRWVRALRLALATTVVVAAATGATPVVGPITVLVTATGLYVIGALAAEELLRRHARAGSRVLGLALLADGVYLAGAATLTGGAEGLVPLLVLVHVTGITLLASYRTGVKIALWHSLLAYAARELHELGLLPAGGLGAAPWRWLVGYVTVLCLVAIGTATFSASNERELRRRRHDFERLAGLAAALKPAEDPEGIARTLAEQLGEALDFPRVVVVDGTGTRVLGAAGLDSVPATLPVAGDGSVLRLAAADRRTQLTTHLDADVDPGLVELLPDATNLVVTPLVADGEVTGLVIAEHASRRTARVEQRIVSAVERFADHGALALRAAELLAEVRTLATTDGLTGTANRRVFDEQLSAELSRTSRSGTPLALLLLDIDHFKPLNDTYGHTTGDEVLRQVADLLRGSVRDFDVVARYGGEEFAVIAPGCDPTDARVAAERLRAAVEEGATTVPVTVSIGVAIAPTHGTEPGALIEAADKALYASKDGGRNRVTIAHAPQAELAGVAG